MGDGVGDRQNLAGEITERDGVGAGAALFANFDLLLCAHVTSECVSVMCACGVTVSVRTGAN